MVIAKVITRTTRRATTSLKTAEPAWKRFDSWLIPLPRPLCSRVRPDVRDRQTSDVRRASSLNALYPNKMNTWPPPTSTEATMRLNLLKSCPKYCRSLFLDSVYIIWLWRAVTYGSLSHKWYETWEAAKHWVPSQPRDSVSQTRTFDDWWTYDIF